MIFFGQNHTNTLSFIKIFFCVVHSCLKHIWIQINEPSKFKYVFLVVRPTNTEFFMKIHPAVFKLCPFLTIYPAQKKKKLRSHRVTTYDVVN